MTFDGEFLQHFDTDLLTQLCELTYFFCARLNKYQKNARLSGLKINVVKCSPSDPQFVSLYYDKGKSGRYARGDLVIENQTQPKAPHGLGISRAKPLASQVLVGPQTQVALKRFQVSFGGLQIHLGVTHDGESLPNPRYYALSEVR